jgi:endo-1,4-beta-mannosidase
MVSVRRVGVEVIRRGLIVAFAVILAIFGLGFPVSAADDGIVTTSDQTLQLNGQPFTMLGFNLWRANASFALPNTGYLLNNGNALNQTLQDINANGGQMNTFRTWFLQQEVTPNGWRYNWAPFDKTLQVAAQNGFKVIAVLADNWGYEGPPQKTYNWYRRGYMTEVDGGTLNGVSYNENVPYLQYVHDVVSRYANNPTIAAWEMVNEPDDQNSDGTCSSSAGQVMLNFANRVGGLIKSIDPNHLVSLGAAGNGNCGTIQGDYETVMDSPNIDLCSFHDYEGATNATAFNQWNGLNVRIQQCADLDKPIYIGESGIRVTDAAVNGDLQARASLLQAKMTAAMAMQGVVGYLPWHFDDRANGSAIDSFSYDPGDPALAVMNQFAAPAATPTPTDTATATPTDSPTDTPTDSPTDTPTDSPTDTPTDSPTPDPSDG